MVFILYKLYILSPYTNPTPKPAHHKKHFAFLHLFCVIYKRVYLNLGPHESVCIQV